MWKSILRPTLRSEQKRCSISNMTIDGRCGEAVPEERRAS